MFNSLSWRTQKGIIPQEYCHEIKPFIENQKQNNMKAGKLKNVKTVCKHKIKIRAYI